MNIRVPPSHPLTAFSASAAVALPDCAPCSRRNAWPCLAFYFEAPRPPQERQHRPSHRAEDDADNNHDQPSILSHRTLPALKGSRHVHAHAAGGESVRPTTPDLGCAIGLDLQIAKLDKHIIFVTLFQDEPVGGGVRA